MSYCLSQGFSPTIFQTQSTFLQVLMYLSQSIFAILGIYIIYKMCQLCSKAFSYENFHIHQAYKFYTLALISTIMIIFSRTVQIQFADKVKTARNNQQQLSPFRKDSYYQGWVILNQILGIISVYSVNLMYALNSMTWLMIVSKCDFNNRISVDQEQSEQDEKRKKKKKFFEIERKFLLYGLLPVCLIFSIFGQLKFEQGWCLASKITTVITNLLIYLVMFYALLDILLQRYKDPTTPLKIKIIWVYIIVAMTIRQISMLMLVAVDLDNPSHRQYTSMNYSDWTGNFITFFYGLFITTIPIFLLSFLADKQLQSQKQTIDKSERIVYSSTII